ncbi:hypothetical protein Tco_0703326 [Tanacetum coccineum]|uniref:Uncharacterized protein n=1 Tax=Tanacetum coccineum TaxID=301880 RepID=A0ABQ4XYI4_9ASTR
MKGSEQSHSFSSGNVPDPQDPKRKKQLAGTGLPSTPLDEGTRKLQPLLEGLPFMVSDKGTVKTTSLPEVSHKDKDSEGFKPATNIEPLTTPVADPSGTNTKYQADQTQSARLRYQSLTKNKGKTSSEVDSDSETLQLTTFVVSPPPNQEQPGSSHAKEQSDKSYSDSSYLVSLKKYDNIFPLTERQLHKEVATSYADLKASVKGYYDENVDHWDQTDKLIKETTKTIDNISKARFDERAKLLKAINRVFETLKAESALKEEMKKMVKSYNTTSKNILGLTELINNAKLQELLTKLEGFQSTLNTLSTQCASIFKSLKEDPEFNQRLLTTADSYIQNSARLTEISISLQAINLLGFHQRISNIENT